MPSHIIRLIALALAGLSAAPAFAWGPHTEITAAAQAVLPDRDRLRREFGDDWDRLAKDYCWTPDWREAVRPDHYADDYLLFPEMPRHPSHMLPEVRQTYEPFFRRALQALRTEEPREAARWVGSLLHFVQDSGSPPHTTGVGGELHSRMERWVDEKKIAIVGYEPKLLGPTDFEAIRGFQGRMEELVEFSKARALKLRPLLEKVTERVNQPLELECALETARVTADVLHTLFTLGRTAPNRGGTLEGRLDTPAPDGCAAVPAKVILAGTHFSTTAVDGRYRFRNLPPGKYRVLFLATGYALADGEAAVRAGETVRLSPTMTADAVPGNLIRNPRFALSWVKPGQPDCWAPDPVKRGRWASALIRVPVGKKCVLRVEFAPGKAVPVSVRWRSDPSSASSGREVELKSDRDADGRLTAEVSPDPLQQPFEKGVLFLEVLLATDGPPGDVVRHIAVRCGS